MIIPIGYIIGIISTLVTAIVAMFFILQRHYKQSLKEQKGLLQEWREDSEKNTERLTLVVVENKHAMELLKVSVDNNTKVCDKIFNELDKATKHRL